MLSYVRKHACRIIIVEKTDRLYRNIADWVKIDDQHLTVHFVKENVIIGPDSRSSEQFMHGIKVLMARNYSQNLGEETKKGQLQKARSGMYPSFAPAGYQNVEGPERKRIIVPHPQEADVIKDLFARFATGEYSIKSLAQSARERGVTLRGRPLHASTLHQILRKKLYMGQFDFDGVTYQGTHEPLVTKETWDAVQQILNDRKEHHTKPAPPAFPYAGMISCGHCGCALVAELKKQRYVYYHCTGRRGKCHEPYTRQETLTEQFATLIATLIIPAEIVDWLTNELNRTTTAEHTARHAHRERLERERERLQRQLRTLYDDRLDGTITKEAYTQKASDLERQLAGIEQQVAALKTSAPVSLLRALDIARLTSNACQAFREQNETEQRKLLATLLKHATWQDGHLAAQMLEPFESLRRSNQLTQTNNKENNSQRGDLKIWLLR